jgi:hypothetical protein
MAIDPHQPIPLPAGLPGGRPGPGQPPAQCCRHDGEETGGAQ